MMMEVQTKERMSILKVIVVILLLLMIYKVSKSIFNNFRNLIVPCPIGMLPNKCNPFLYSVIYILSIFRQSRKSGLPLPLLIFQSVLGMCCEVVAKERIFFLYLFQKPGVILYKPETVQVVLSSSTIIEKSVHYSFIHSWLGRGLFTSPGSKWRHRKKLLAPTFHSSILENFIPVFQEQSSILVSKLRALTKEPWVDISPLANLCTLDIICQTAMGVRINAQTNENKEYVKALHEVTEAITNRPFRPWLYPDIIYYMTTEGKRYKSYLQCMHGLTRKVIKEKKAEMLEHNTSKEEKETTGDTLFPVQKRKAFLEYLLEYHFKDPSLTEEDIKEEVDTFLFAGHDTTGMGISWILYCIGLYPEVQKKVVDELDQIFQNEPEREVTREDLTKMKYLECAIKETFRLYPPASFLMRECEEKIEILGHTIFPGSFCAVFTYALHRDPESFPDPERFIPERFFPENCIGRHPYAYVPFSSGPRNCIGQKFGMMEMKVLAANVLRSFQVTSLDPRDKVLVVPNLTLKNAKPLRLRFEIRRKR
ncbi:unnamed protein product [Larinioides sclopetarius]|uniref:Cytochrome P450 n=1 Tax=Larinioides sclopetarius TaxID=280406 RepID=A0AAV1ZIV2_9ARAC